MKWQSHRIIGVGTAAVFDGGLAAAVLSYFGSTLPDVVEGKPPQEGGFFFKHKMGAWRKSHRGSSHWVGWYVVLALLGHHYHPSLMWLGIGAMTHLAADALTPMGVPLLPFSKKKMFSLNLFSTGSFGELIFSVTLVAGLIFYISKYQTSLHVL